MPAPAAPIELTSTRGRVTVFLRAHRAGADLVVTIAGGDRAHVGAVAVSLPRLNGGGKSATTSVITVPGHREDELARRAAARIATALGVTTCVACGIHLDAITRPEIGDVEEIVDELTDGLLAAIGGAALR